MATVYALGPSIGVARVGNSPDSFYLAPDRIGGLPFECGPHGDVLLRDGAPVPVRRFKDEDGRVRRQAALFRVFRIDEDNPQGIEITLDTPGIAAIEWNVHLANKKACWFSFAELEGNLLYGEENSYQARGVPLRNPKITDEGARRRLIVDPGPRKLAGRCQAVALDSGSVPKGYAHASFPAPALFGERVASLGDLLTDGAGRLVLLGGFGAAGGDVPINSFAGADSWHDDISDGPIVCLLRFEDGSTAKIEGWCIVGSPKFAPEVVNIVTLADTAWDCAVRNLDAAPDLFRDGAFDPDYVAGFDEEILPILVRPGGYRWVANTPSMNSLSPPPFDARDSGEGARPLREAYLAQFRPPSPQNGIGPAANILFTPEAFPMMPLNSGSNSVANQMTDKFLTLTQTQYFLLGQWAAGKFRLDRPAGRGRADALSLAAAGNCVGGPFCPGIEVTWTLRNPNIYQGPLRIRHRHDEAWYFANGLSPDVDETADALGCEPGDLTKRMAIPWQADFFQCAAQYVNFTQPELIKVDHIPVPPTYYAYWWPPQSPLVVMTGDLTPESQRAAGTSAGFQVPFTRGIGTFSQMLAAWSYIGFVANQASGASGELFPYLAEQERNHKAFEAASVSVANAGNVVSPWDATFVNSWFLPQPPAPVPVRFPTSRHHGRVSIRD